MVMCKYRLNKTLLTFEAHTNHSNSFDTSRHKSEIHHQIINLSRRKKIEHNPYLHSHQAHRMYVLNAHIHYCFIV